MSHQQLPSLTNEFDDNKPKNSENKFKLLLQKGKLVYTAVNKQIEENNAIMVEQLHNESEQQPVLVHNSEATKSMANLH